jgi:hypothetical protein
MSDEGGEDEDKRNEKDEERDRGRTDDQSLHLGWKDYLALFVALLETVALPVVVLIVILLIFLLLIRAVG